MKVDKINNFIETKPTLFILLIMGFIMLFTLLFPILIAIIILLIMSTFIINFVEFLKQKFKKKRS